MKALKVILYLLLFTLAVYCCVLALFYYPVIAGIVMVLFCAVGFFILFNMIFRGKGCVKLIIS